MNRVQATITDIKSNGNISLVYLESSGIRFTSVILDNAETSPFVQKGKSIIILFKETEVVLASGEPGRISLRNRIEGSVARIEKGELLSRVITKTALGEVRAVITSAAIDELNIKTGDSILCMIKTNELMLSE